jgi:hypothetical protein
VYEWYIECCMNFHIWLQKNFGQFSPYFTPYQKKLEIFFANQI